MSQDHSASTGGPSQKEGFVETNDAGGSDVPAPEPERDDEQAHSDSGAADTTPELRKLDPLADTADRELEDDEVVTLRNAIAHGEECQHR
jgi:hypothetical protein